MVLMGVRRDSVEGQTLVTNKQNHACSGQAYSSRVTRTTEVIPP
jgi:hypothetical protein